MALYVLGDTHLSLGGSKPMDIFPGWDGYVERLERVRWRRGIHSPQRYSVCGPARALLQNGRPKQRIPLYWRGISAGPCA